MHKKFSIIPNVFYNIVIFHFFQSKERDDVVIKSLSAAQFSKEKMMPNELLCVLERKFSAITRGHRKFAKYHD